MAFDDNELNQRRQQHREERKSLAAQRKLLRIGFIVTGIGGMAMAIGDVTLTTTACALILGIITNLILSKGKE